MIIRRKIDLVLWVCGQMIKDYGLEEMEIELLDLDQGFALAEDLAVRISKWGGKLCPDWGADWSFFLWYFSNPQFNRIDKIIEGNCPGCETTMQTGNKIFCPKCDPIAKGDLQLLARAGEVAVAIEKGGMKLVGVSVGGQNDLGWGDWEWMDIGFLDMRGRERVVRISKLFGDRGAFDLNVVLGANFEPNRIERVCSILGKGLWDTHDCYSN